MEQNKLEMVLVLVKGKLMKEHRMLEIKLNFKNKFKDKKDNKKMKTKMLERIKKMIFKCKEISKAICMRKNKNRVKVKNRIRQNKKSQMNKWVKLTINKESKI